MNEFEDFDTGEDLDSGYSAEEVLTEEDLKDIVAKLAERIRGDANGGNIPKMPAVQGKTQWQERVQESARPMVMETSGPYAGWWKRQKEDGTWEWAQREPGKPEAWISQNRLDSLLGAQGTVTAATGTILPAQGLPAKSSAASPDKVDGDKPENSASIPLGGIEPKLPDRDKFDPIKHPRKEPSESIFAGWWRRYNGQLDRWEWADLDHGGADIWYGRDELCTALARADKIHRFSFDWNETYNPYSYAGRGSWGATDYTPAVGDLRSASASEPLNFVKVTEEMLLDKREMAQKKKGVPAGREEGTSNQSPSETERTGEFSPTVQGWGSPGGPVTATVAEVMAGPQRAATRTLEFRFLSRNPPGAVRPEFMFRGNVQSWDHLGEFVADIAATLAEQNENALIRRLMAGTVTREGRAELLRSTDEVRSKKFEIASLGVVTKVKWPADWTSLEWSHEFQVVNADIHGWNDSQAAPVRSAKSGEVGYAYWPESNLTILNPQNLTWFFELFQKFAGSPQKQGKIRLKTSLRRLAAVVDDPDADELLLDALSAALGGNRLWGVEGGSLSRRPSR